MKIPRLVLGIALASAAAAPASAVVTKTTYSGILFDGSDDSGLFGGPTSLAGQTAYLSFFFDDATPGATRTTTATSDTLDGGAAATPGYATIRINGVTLRLDPTYAFATQGSNAAFDEIRHSVQRSDYDPDTGNYYNIEVLAKIYQSDPRFIPHPVNVNSAFDYVPVPIDDPSAYYAYFETNRSDDGGATNIFANGSFIPTRITVSAVPEPATWAMMIVGFGMAGAFLRRRSASRPVTVRA